MKVTILKNIDFGNIYIFFICCFNKILNSFTKDVAVRTFHFLSQEEQVQINLE